MSYFDEEWRRATRFIAPPPPPPPPPPPDPTPPPDPVGDFASDLSLRALPGGDFNADALFGIGTHFRQEWDRMESFRARGGLSGSITPPHMNRWNSSAAQRGQYFTSRGLGNYAHEACLETRASKSLKPLREYQKLWARARAVIDRDSGVQTTTPSQYDGWTYGTLAGGGTSISNHGKRILLESGVIAAVMTAAHGYHVNRDLDSSFATTRNEIMSYYLNHHIPSHRAYHGQDKTMSATRPLVVQKNFSHANTSEMTAHLAIAKIQSGDAWATNPYGADAIRAFNLWNIAGTVPVLQTSDIRSAADRVYGINRIWGQRTTGWANNSGTQFTQLNTYLNETCAHLMYLYLEGLITRCLGSQAAADAWMQSVVNTFQVAIFPQELRASRRWTNSMRGLIQQPDGSWRSVYTVSPLGGTDSGYRTISNALNGLTMIFAAFDQSRRLHDIRREFYAAGGSRDHTGSPIVGMLTHAWQDGRLS